MGCKEGGANSLPGLGKSTNRSPGAHFGDPPQGKPAAGQFASLRGPPSHQLLKVAPQTLRTTSVSATWVMPFGKTVRIGIAILMAWRKRVAGDDRRAPVDRTDNRIAKGDCRNRHGASDYSKDQGIFGSSRSAPVGMEALEKQSDARRRNLQSPQLNRPQNCRLSERAPQAYLWTWVQSPSASLGSGLEPAEIRSDGRFIWS